MEIINSRPIIRDAELFKLSKSAGHLTSTYLSVKNIGFFFKSRKMACMKSINVLQQLKNCHLSSRLISTSARALCQTRDVTHTGQVCLFFMDLNEINKVLVSDYASTFLF